MSSGARTAAPEGERDIPRVSEGRRNIHSLPAALPTNWGSQQWRLMRRAIRDGASIEDAADLAGMSLVEARILAKLDADRAPLPEEAFTLLYDPAARAAQQAKEAGMTEDKDDPEAGEGGGISDEYHRPDAAMAIKIYKNEIAPKNAHMQTIKGDLADPHKRIKDDCHFPRKVLDFLMQLDDMEEAKRDHWLLAFNLGLQELDLFIPKDLVTMAQGEDGGNVIPFGERKDETDDLSADLDGASQDIFEEASEEELAAQTGRPSVEKAKAKAEAAAEEDPKPGTGAAARKKMKDSAKADAGAALH